MTMDDYKRGYEDGMRDGGDWPAKLQAAEAREAALRKANGEVALLWAEQEGRIRTLEAALLEVADYGNTKVPEESCWCGDREYGSKRPHYPWCLLARAALAQTGAAPATGEVR